MAKFNYAHPAATALRMLKRYGAPVTLRRPGTGEYDPGTGTVDSEPTDYPGTGAKFDYEQRNIDGTKILQGDQQVYLAVQQDNGQAMPRPKAGDLVLVGTEAWRVVTAESIEPASVPVLYIVQVRK